MTEQQQHFLGTLDPEQRLDQLHRSATTTIPSLQRQKSLAFCLPLVYFLFLLTQSTSLGRVTLVLMMGFLLYLVWEQFRTRRERRHWSQLKQQVRELVPELRRASAVGPLLDFAHWRTLDGDAFQELTVALERLLPRLDAPSARLLTESQRAFLRRCADNQEPTVELVVAALLVLGSAGDRETIPIASKLATSSSSQRIRDAAILCLEELGQRA